MKVALTCIAKDEDFYLIEWIEYHKKLGFNHIFIYENDWVSNIKLSDVTTIPFPGKRKQLDAYNQFISKYKNDYDYVAFLDCDEFLVLKKHKTVQDFLSEYKPSNGIGINWQFYGSCNKTKREENSLLKQFTKRQKDVDKHVKAIINLKSNIAMSLPHNPNKPIINTNKQEFAGPFNVRGTDDVAIINHYYCKTYDDWIIRCNRGRADCDLKVNIKDWAEESKKNCDVEDLTAYNFMYNNFNE